MLRTTGLQPIASSLSFFIDVLVFFVICFILFHVDLVAAALSRRAIGFATSLLQTNKSAARLSLLARPLNACLRPISLHSSRISNSLVLTPSSSLQSRTIFNLLASAASSASDRIDTRRHEEKRILQCASFADLSVSIFLG
jgi:hypothetical protein